MVNFQAQSVLTQPLQSSTTSLLPQTNPMPQPIAQSAAPAQSVIQQPIQSPTDNYVAPVMPNYGPVTAPPSNAPPISSLGSNVNLQTPLQPGQTIINQQQPIQQQQQQQQQQQIAQPMANFQNQNLMTSTGQLANTQQPNQNPISQPTPSIEQQALSGNNKQNISNFMSALNNVGAGGNNSFMANKPATGYVPPNLVDPNMVNNVAPNQGNLNPALLQGTTAGVINNPQNTGTIGGGNLALGTTTDNNSNMVLPTYTDTSVLPGRASQDAQALNPAPKTATSVLPGSQSWAATSPVVDNLNNSVDNNPLTGLTISDENLKTAIKPADNKVQDFLSKINAHNYQYKNPELDGIGQFTSPMAQELEATDLGKQAVINTPRGKMVNYGRLGAVNLAAVSVVHKEQMKMQKQLNQLQDRLSSAGLAGSTNKRK